MQREKVKRPPRREKAIPDKGVRGWIQKTAVKNYWRVAGILDLDDLIADGYLWYYQVRVRYPQAKDRAHIMRLFQTTYINYITDLARRREVIIRRHGQLQVDGLIAGEHDHDDLTKVITEAPPMLRALLSKLDLSFFTAKGSVNTRLCALVGLDPTEHDLATELRSYLRG